MKDLIARYHGIVPLGLYFTILFIVLGLPKSHASVYTDPTIYNITSNEIVDVYDGDTFYIQLNGLPTFFGQRLPIRIRGVDTPEIRNRCVNPTVKEEVKRRALAARGFLVQSLGVSTKIKIHNIDRGNFFRLVADIEIDGVDLKEQIVKAGHGMITIDGHQFDWCDYLINNSNKDTHFP